MDLTAKTRKQQIEDLENELSDFEKQKTFRRFKDEAQYETYCEKIATEIMNKKPMILDSENEPPTVYDLMNYHSEKELKLSPTLEFKKEKRYKVVPDIHDFINETWGYVHRQASTYREKAVAEAFETRFGFSPFYEDTEILNERAKQILRECEIEFTNFKQTMDWETGMFTDSWDNIRFIKQRKREKND